MFSSRAGRVTALTAFATLIARSSRLARIPWPALITGMPLSAAISSLTGVSWLPGVSRLPGLALGTGWSSYWSCRWGCGAPSNKQSQQNRACN